MYRQTIFDIDGFGTVLRKYVKKMLSFENVRYIIRDEFGLI